MRKTPCIILHSCYNTPVPVGRCILRETAALRLGQTTGIAGINNALYLRGGNDSRKELNMKNKKLQVWVRLALLVAIEVAMRLLGLGKVPVGPLNMSFLTLPIAVGAVCMGPVAGMVLGMVFGLFSLYDAVSGVGGMTAAFFAVSPVHTVVLTVGMRMLMGLCCGLVYQGVRKLDRKGIVSYFVGAISAPLLNTLFFMGYIVLVFYNTQTVQDLVAAKGATNPLMFVVLLVGIQGLAEAVVCGILGGIVSKSVDKFLKSK